MCGATERFSANSTRLSPVCPFGTSSNRMVVPPPTATSPVWSTNTENPPARSSGTVCTRSAAVTAT